MRKIQAQPITDHSWILWEWGNRVGLLSEHVGEWNLLHNEGSMVQVTIDQIQEKLNWQIEFQTEADTSDTDVPCVTQIEGLPVKHDTPCDIELEPRITYAKTSKSKSRYAAGFWLIKFDTGWSGALCPKCTTLDQYGHEGPIQSKLEMNTILRQKNRSHK